MVKLNSGEMFGLFHLQKVMNKLFAETSVSKNSVQIKLGSPTLDIFYKLITEQLV